MWVEAPQWPVSAYFGELMLFVGQVALDPALFGGEPGRMAYFFITDPDAFDGLTIHDTDSHWGDPFDGENAVIIQPGGQLLDPELEVRPTPTGPGLVRYARTKSRRGGIPARVEFSATATPGEDPDYFDPSTLTDAQLQETKVGGTPALIIDLGYPDLEGWTSILQVDLGHPPFDLGLEPFWVMHGLLSPDGTTGAFVSQDPYADEYYPTLPDEYYAMLPDDDDEAPAEPASADDGETWAVAADEDQDAGERPPVTQP